jgi:D-threo-aldose 1-dehydrogenase
MKKRRFKAPSGAELNFTELGFGSAPLGNLYRPHTNAEALATFEAAWKAGIRYFDTAPLYGLGLSETRLGNFLYGKKRSDYIVSTKVGRVLEMSTPTTRTAIGKFFNTPSRKYLTTVTMASCGPSNFHSND